MSNPVSDQEIVRHWNTLRAAGGVDFPHLEYEQMEAYVDGTLSPAQMDEARTHVSVCQTCAHEVLDLEDFRRQMQQPEATLAARPERWQREMFPLRQAASVAALGVAGLLIYLWQTRGGPVTQVASGNSTVRVEDSQLATEMADLPPHTRLAVAEAIDRRRLDFPPSLQGLRQQTQTLLGSADARAGFAVLGPAGEVVNDPRPTFRWQPLDAAASYSVAIFDAGLHEIQHSPELHTTQWQAPQALERGHLYQWQVTARMKDGTNVISPKPPAAEARIEILQQPAADELQRFRQAHADSHLVLGILYAHGGMLTDAARELEKVPADDPRHDTAKVLLELLE